MPCLKAASRFATEAGDPSDSQPTRRMDAEGCPRLCPCAMSRTTPPASKILRRVNNQHLVNEGGSPSYANSVIRASQRTPLRSHKPPGCADVGVTCCDDAAWLDFHLQ